MGVKRGSRLYVIEVWHSWLEPPVWRAIDVSGTVLAYDTRKLAKEQAKGYRKTRIVAYERKS